MQDLVSYLEWYTVSSWRTVCAIYNMSGGALSDIHYDFSRENTTKVRVDQ